jgi:ribosome-associated protein
MTKVLLEAQALADIAIKGLQEVKGQEILKMDLRNSDGSVTDFFLICTGTSDRHVQALGDSVLKFIKEAGELPHSKEGFDKGDWVLLDYINVVVHIFQEEARNFYRLEKLWGDAEFERIAEE